MTASQRVLQAISWTGLALSLLALTVAAPGLIERGGGFGIVLGNAAQYGWTIALLFLVFARTHTIGARAVTGAALAGFFGVTALAVWIGKPFASWSLLGGLALPVLVAPVTEELLKLLPVALFVLLAARNRRWRPSLGDAVLFGVAVASGFGLYENILFARSTGGGVLTTLPLSALLPSITAHDSMLVGGHVVYTGLASLGLAVTVLYGRRFAVARFALPVAFFVVVMEHVAVNDLSSMGIMAGFAPWWTRLAVALSFGGYLSTLLFVAGVAAVAVFEARLVRRGAAALPAALRWRDTAASFEGKRRIAGLAELQRRLRYESMRRSAIFAAAQTRSASPDDRASDAVRGLRGKTTLAAGAAA
jgi:RsiW-degrading membrane proteinase PrsW (M82 family)